MAMLVAGCTSGDGDQDGTTVELDAATDATPAVGSRSDRKPTIAIGVTDWTGARLNVAIAEELIERRLGYPVEPVEVLETGAMLRDLQRGDLDAVLEVWPSSLDPDELEIIASQAVEPLGELGVVGRIGWFVPRFVLDQHPDVETWQGLVDPAVAAEFASPETGTKGRFLGTDPNYEQNDEELIDALGLAFEVVYSGSDAATTSELERATAAGQPVLVYWWSPTAQISRFDLVSVELPARTPECVAEIEAGGPQRCDYPIDRLLKIGSPELVETAPDVHRFLGDFSLTTEDQLLMIDRVENRGESLELVASDWISANEALWEPWLD